MIAEVAQSHRARYPHTDHAASTTIMYAASSAALMDLAMGSSGLVARGGTQRTVIETGIEGGGAQSHERDAVAVSFRNALGEAVEAQPTQSRS
jgi:hypothetical protein